MFGFSPHDLFIVDSPQRCLQPTSNDSACGQILSEGSLFKAGSSLYRIATMPQWTTTFVSYILCKPVSFVVFFFFCLFLLSVRYRMNTAYWKYFFLKQEKEYSLTETYETVYYYFNLTFVRVGCCVVAMSESKRIKFKLKRIRINIIWTIKV